jgi:hypothetical protein
MAKAPGKRGGRDDSGDQRKYKFPPRPRNHQITHAVARRMRLAYINKYGNNPDALAPGAYARAIFEKILKDRRCVGIRFYPGLDAEGQVTVLFCGVDKEGNDILVGVIGDRPWRCPPMCSTANGVLQF